MRIFGGNLGDFVGGAFAVPQNPVTGMGDFVGGRFAVPSLIMGPQGMSGLADFVPGSFAVPSLFMGGMGALVPSSPMYPVGSNSVLDYFESGGVNYQQGISGLSAGCGCSGKKPDCGCGGGCSGGMGELNLPGGITLFSGDMSTWGVPEFIAIGFGLYVVSKIFGDTKRVGSSVSKFARGRAKKKRTAAQIARLKAAA